MSKTDFLGPIETEIEERLRVLKSNNIHKEYQTWKEAVNRQSSRDILEYSNDFLLELPFVHEGLTKEQYRAHCYRVSTMALHFSEKNCEIAGVVGLLHNILEVTGISIEKVQEEFGTEVSSSLSTLKINRKLQRDEKYLKKYYGNIKHHSSYLYRVKVVDKLDNLFVLGINPSTEIRNIYLEEIENNIVPLASEMETELAEYFRSLIKYNKEIGHFTKEKF